MNRKSVWVCLGVILCLAAQTGGQAGAWPSRPLVLESEALRAKFDPHSGALTEILNKATGDVVRFKADSPAFGLGTTTLTLARARLVATGQTADRIVLSFQSGDYTLRRIIELPRQAANPRGLNPMIPRNHTIQRRWEIENSKGGGFLLTRITPERLRARRAFGQVIQHTDNTLYEASICMFARTGASSLFIGMEYPFTDFESDPGRKTLGLSAKLFHRVKPGEKFVSETTFIGLATLTQRYVLKELSTPPRIIRTHQQVLDLGEVWAMQEYMKRYVPEYPNYDGRRYWYWLNAWWHIANMTPMWDSHPMLKEPLEKEEYAATYRKMIDLESELGIKAFMTGTCYLGMTNASSLSPYLQSLKDQPESFKLTPLVEQVQDYARSKGLRGFGWSCADTDYRPDRPDLYAVDKNGKPYAAAYFLPKGFPCYAHQPNADWFFRLTDTAITRYQLGGWAWDYAWMGGRDFACYATTHDHLPGHGAYEQYKNIMECLRRLRERHPDGYISIYWGLKEGGPWAQKYLTDRENLSESAWADDDRFQQWYMQNYNFMPAWLNYCQFGLSTRGPEYNLMGCLAGGTHLQIANAKGLMETPELRAFFLKWMKWADANGEYLRVKRDLFGQPLREDGLDGSAHMLGGNGYIFLFNPSAQEAIGEIPLSPLIGLESNGPFTISALYPFEAPLGQARAGESIHILVRPNTAMLLAVKEINPGAPAPQAAIFSPDIKGKLTYESDGTVRGEQVTGPSRESGWFSIYTQGRPVRRVLFNGREFPAARLGGLLVGRVHFYQEAGADKVAVYPIRPPEPLPVQRAFLTGEDVARRLKNNNAEASKIDIH